jgi:ElaB/YqjD/DUF883 family membrane-anchored ribosome-binding protein
MTNDPDEIRRDIEQTQRELSADVDALAEKVNPARVVERRVERTRGAVTSLKERIMGTTSSTRDSVSSTASSAASSVSDSVSSAASSVSDTVTSAPEMARQRAQGNPLAAGLIAFGAGWLVSSLLPPSSAEQRVATQVKDTVTDRAQPVITEQLGEAAQEMKEALREPAQQAAESVKETATDAARSVQEETRSAADDVASQAQQSKDTVTERAQGPG